MGSDNPYPLNKIPNSDVIIRRSNRIFASFEAQHDSDIDRGNALIAANAAAQSGDQIILGCGNFDTNASGRTFTSTSGVSWRGQGMYNTIIGSSVASAESFHAAGTCTIDDLQFAPLAGADINESFLTDVGSIVTINNCWINDAYWAYGGSIVFNNCRFESSITLSAAGADATLFGCRQFYSDTSAAINVNGTCVFRSFGCDHQHAGNGSSGFLGTQGTGTPGWLFVGSRLWLKAGTAVAVGPASKISPSNTIKLVSCDIIAPAGGIGVQCNNNNTITLVGGQTSGPTGTSGTALQRVGGTLNVGNHTYAHNNVSGSITDLNA